MSKKAAPETPQREGVACTEGESVDRPISANRYEVGYGKPPVSTRFVKGQSGNPQGRPRKPKPRPPRLSDGLSERFLEEEAYRPVALRENGQAIELAAAQAVIRSLAAGAIKGNRLSQKYFIEHLARLEQRNLERDVQNYVRLESLKRAGEKLLAAHERRGLPPPDLLPHPEDIVLRPSAGVAYVNGPETPEEVPLYEHVARLRDHLLLYSGRFREPRKSSSPVADTNEGCGYLIFAQLLDLMLPPRYRWKDGACLCLLMSYQSLTKRERERRIAAEFAQLKATKPRPLVVTPELEREFDRILDRVRRNWKEPPNAGSACG